MNEFFNMGGYASYVWTCYGLSFLVIVLNVWWAYARAQKVRRRLTGERVAQPEPTRPTVRQIQ
jgi:heme exporter protein CcmD